MTTEVEAVPASLTWQKHKSRSQSFKHWYTLFPLASFLLLVGTQWMALCRRFWRLAKTKKKKRWKYTIWGWPNSKEVYATTFKALVYLSLIPRDSKSFFPIREGLKRAKKFRKERVKRWKTKTIWPFTLI